MGTPPADPAGTGLADLDRVLGGLRRGDNVVWQVDTVEDYAAFVGPFADAALATRGKLVYFRFARHEPLLAPGRAEIHRLDPGVGFETFTASIHRVVEEAGRGASYVFDCLSDLAADWYSDLMLGNFFRVTCPYLFELDTVTYFALLRDHHSQEAVSTIRDTTQLLLDLFRHEGALYVHPLKVDGRHSPTMYLPHAWRSGGAFRPLTESSVLADVLAGLSERRAGAASRLDAWERRFQEAREVLDGIRSGARPAGDAREVFEALLGMMITRDERLASLARRCLDLADLLAVRRRMIGTGLVGGKAAGMLVARAILARADARWSRRLEPHDSWFVGSDVFYTYLVRNGLWRFRRERRARASLLDGAAEARERILEGTFPDFVRQQLVAMLEHYGQSPIIVRSSSLLEDGFGNAFTGKYESVFCPNQGSPQERLEAFLAAVRTVYASTMSEEALRYREHRGLLGRDEQMAILVQRVSGAVHGRFFYPEVAGVALSYNPYVWSPAIDPEAGMMRLVFGLGTRAVERSDDDYTRIVSLGAPLLRPEASPEEATEHAQRQVDAIDLEANRFGSAPFDEVMAEDRLLPVELFATRRGAARALTFERLLGATSFVEEMRALLATLRDAYRHPVDVEFTANFLAGGDFRVNLVQCRPLQMKEGFAAAAAPQGLPEEAILLRSRGPVVGTGASVRVDRVLYVDPDAYALLASRDRYEVARLVGRLTRLPAGQRTVLLLGPGRWGTSTVSLGVPVSFAEIQRVAAICEIVRMGMGVVPDVSLGSHFFNDLVESGIVYLALHPGRPGHRLDEALLREAPNRLAELLPDDAGMAKVVRVVDFPLPDGRRLRLLASGLAQEALCWLEAPSRDG